MRCFSAILCTILFVQTEAFTLIRSIRPTLRRYRVDRVTVAALDINQVIVQDIADVGALMVGGTFGVMGTLSAIEVKKRGSAVRAQCPYCNGGGRISCAVCLGGGSVMISNSQDASSTVCECKECSGSGRITCVNCKGDGRNTPAMLDRTVSRDPESDLEDLGIL